MARPDPKPGTPAPVAGVRSKAAFLAPFDLPPARTRFEIGNHTQRCKESRKDYTRVQSLQHRCVTSWRSWFDCLDVGAYGVLGAEYGAVARRVRVCGGAGSAFSWNRSTFSQLFVDLDLYHQDRHEPNTDETEQQPKAYCSRLQCKAPKGDHPTPTPTAFESPQGGTRNLKLYYKGPR